MENTDPTNQKEDYNIEIEINKNESYRLKIPKIIKRDFFFELIGRLNHIQKMLGKDPLIQIAQEKPGKWISNKRQPRGQILINIPDKETAIDLFKIYYSGRNTKFNEIFEKYKITKAQMYSKAGEIKRKYNIQNSDIKGESNGTTT